MVASAATRAAFWASFVDRAAVDPMKRVGTWIFYAIGVLAILYLALYAYVTFTGGEFTPGDPIHIFRKPDAPSYS